LNVHKSDICFIYHQLHDIQPTGALTVRVGLASVLTEGTSLEVHFGKPVVARVKKCRLVVVKKRHNREENDEQVSAP